jgi:hypothetical protein
MHGYAGATMRLDGCTLRGISAEFFGGAISGSDSGMVELKSCLLKGNNAHVGGAIFSAGEVMVVLAACVLTGNSAVVDGGGNVRFCRDGDYIEQLYLERQSCFQLRRGSLCC